MGAEEKVGVGRSPRRQVGLLEEMGSVVEKDSDEEGSAKREMIK